MRNSGRGYHGTAALEVIKENPQAVADYKAGKEKALNSLVGVVMKKTRGKADAMAAREVLLKKMGVDVRVEN